MSEEKIEDNVEATSDSDRDGHGQTNQPEPPPPTSYPFPLRRLAILGTVVAITVFVAQRLAPQFDHQNANFITLVAILVFGLYLVYATHRYVTALGISWIVVPGAIIGMSALLLTIFRFEGFSGEMAPQFSYRFGNEEFEIQELDPSVVVERAKETAVESEAVGANQESAKDQPTTVDVDPDPIGSAAVAAANWPQFLGANRNGVYKERLFSVPSEQRTAKELWNIGVGKGWGSFAVHGDRAITIEQRKDAECVTCYRLSDGKLLWIDKYDGYDHIHQHTLGGVGPRTTPAIVGARVYANGATGFLRCLDLMTGERLWTADLLEKAGWNQTEFEQAAPWGHASSPLITNGMCVIGFGGPVDPAILDANGMTGTAKSLIALDLKSGQEVWRAGIDQFSYASPMLMKLSGKQQIVSVNEKTISGHEIKDGKQLWTVDWPGATNAGANCASAIPFGDSQFVIGKGYGGGSALIEIGPEPSIEPSEVWASSRVLKTKFNHTCVGGDVGYGLNNGSLQAVDIPNAKSLWIQPRRSRFGQGQAILLGDVLVAQAEMGDVVFVAADPDAYKELGRLSPLSSKTWNIPTVAGRHLIVRNDRQAVCYLLPPK